MADIDHSTLTGSALHEPKGADTASADQVYVANGSGSGTWTATSTFNPFGAKFFHAREQRASGTDSQQTFTINTWVKALLTNEVTDDIGLTLSGNSIALPSGTYYVKGRVPIVSGGSLRAKFYDETSSSDLVLGSVYKTINNVSAGRGLGFLEVEGRFTLASTKTCSLQVYTTGSTNDKIQAIESGSVEVYNQLYLWKTA